MKIPRIKLNISSGGVVYIVKETYMYARKHRLHDQGLSRVDGVIRMLINSYFKGLCVIQNFCNFSEHFVQVFETCYRCMRGDPFKSAYEPSNCVRP